MTFARDYPASTRTVLVDGPYLPDQERVEDLRGAEVVINKIFNKCASDAACAAKFPDLRRRFLAALPKIRQQPIVVGEERINDERVGDFMVDSLYGGARPTFETRVQRVIAYADAAAKDDGAAMVQIEKKMRDETPAPPRLPDQGRWTVGQNLSIDCREEKPLRIDGRIHAGRGQVRTGALASRERGRDLVVSSLFVMAHGTGRRIREHPRVLRRTHTRIYRGTRPYAFGTCRLQDRDDLRQCEKRGL